MSAYSEQPNRNILSVSNSDNQVKIIINPELIKAPGKCINYVITHELCHLIEPNHGTKFYELLSDILPDWEKWKSKLEQLLA